MVYISEYLPKFAANIHVDCIWDPNSNDKSEREYLTGKGRLRRVRGNYKLFLYSLLILIHHQYKLFLTSLVIFFIVGHEWDALHLYIENNLDWMTVWIQQSQ